MGIDGSTLIGRGLARTLAGLAAIVAVLALAGPAAAYNVASGWSATTYASDFPHSDLRIGPVGLAFDRNANLLVTDAPAGELYKIPAGGGSAQGNRLNHGFGTATAGLAFDLQGNLFMARRDAGDVIQVDQRGHYLRTVVSGLSCPVGLATDPASGDLFVSNDFCPRGGIMRIQDGIARPYAGTQDADGITFAPDGTLYAAAGTKVVRIDGTTSVTAGRVTDVGDVPQVDGIAYAPATASGPAYLVVNRNDGEIDRLDLDGGAPRQILTGGSRGDFVTVGPDRCIYATQTDRILKLGPSSGLCNFAPPATPGGIDAGVGGGSGGANGGDPGGDQEVLAERFAASQQQRVADLRIAAGGPRAARVGRLATYSLTVRNGGPATAHNVVVTYRLAQGLSLVRARAAATRGCTHKGRAVTCRRASLAMGKSFTVSVTVRIVSGSRWVNHARVRSRDLDPAPGDNSLTQRTRRTR